MQQTRRDRASASCSGHLMGTLSRCPGLMEALAVMLEVLSARGAVLRRDPVCAELREGPIRVRWPRIVYMRCGELILSVIMGVAVVRGRCVGLWLEEAEKYRDGRQAEAVRMALVASEEAGRQKDEALAEEREGRLATEATLAEEREGRREERERTREIEATLAAALSALAHQSSTPPTGLTQ
ncbi:hypothetical protein BD779DRAFT_1786794 [Infundibulicybe gibba]|nr:hypothetical protein BD779DRAFT_1786794 [Infundibulicybe gibba]